MLGEEVDMVGDNHYVANLKFRIHAACRVAYKEGFYSEFVHNADWECHGLHVITLVEVKTALHGHYRTVAETTENQVAAMSFDSRYRKIGYLVVGYILFVGY